MGVKGFYHYSKPYQKNLDLTNEYRVGIDALSLLYKFRGDLKKIFDFLKPILNQKLLFVFDGKAPESKQEELQKRKRSIDAIQEKIHILKITYYSTDNEETKQILKNEIQKLEYSSWKVTYEIREEMKTYLIEHNYRFVKSNQEADDVLINLYYANYIDVVLSSDMDFLIAGIDILWVPEKNEIREIHLKDILEEEEINKEQLKEVAILCGIDNNRICIMDDVSYAMQLIRHYGSIESIMKYKENFISLLNPNYIRDVKKRYYPNKEDPFIHVKEEHKEFLNEFKPK